MNLQLNLVETKIRMARLCLTQKALAEKSGVSRPTLSYALNGKSLNPDIIGKISKALDCDVSEIVMESR